MEISITVLIIAITTLVSVIGFNNENVIDELIFYPPAVLQRFQWYRYFTCGLIHADVAHLLFNMLSLYLFGPMVEAGFAHIFGASGPWLYLAMYVTALFVSLVPSFLKNKNNRYYRSLGASGAVSAVIFAGLVMVPTIGVSLFFIPIPIPGFIFAPLYLLLSFYLEKKGGTNINHSAHIWGSLYGLAYVIVLCSLVGYPILQHMSNEIQGYLQAKGWM